MSFCLVFVFVLVLVLVVPSTRKIVVLLLQRRMDSLDGSIQEPGGHGDDSNEALYVVLDVQRTSLLLVLRIHIAVAAGGTTGSWGLTG